MNSDTIHIKNMVCPRCIKAVSEIFTEHGLNPVAVELGKVVIPKGSLKKEAVSTLEEALEQEGFELLKDQSVQYINEIKSFIIDLIYGGELGESNEILSHQISTSIGKDYSYLSHLFSSVEGITIERYFILQKIERVKELLTYDEFSLKELAYQLGYSSNAHLSRQFKEVTGLTPTQFKQMQSQSRRSIDAV